MKKTFAMLATCLLTMLTGFSQKISADKVPAAVRQAFEKKFPAATFTSYEMDKKEYEVNFREEQMIRSASFDQDGKWLETETEMKESNLPEEVAASLVKNFPGFKASEIVMVETPDQGLQFEMELKKEKEAYELLFSPAGDIIKQEISKPEKD